MRTTLTLDPEVVAMIKKEVHDRRSTFKEIVNEAIRRGLTAPGAAGEPFRVEPHHAHLMPGFDRHAFNRLADELEDESVIAKVASERPYAKKR